MVSDSDDEELSKLQRAAAFIEEVRRAQNASGKLQTGGNFLSPRQKLEVSRATAGSALVAAVKTSVNADLSVNYLAERFEEMCRRQEATVDAELRPSIVKLLAAELLVNQKALDVPAKKLISATLHHGAIVPELLKEYDKLPYSRLAVYSAVTARPGAPREFLERAAEEIKALSTDPEFRLLLEKRPSDLPVAAIHPGSARSRLRKIAKDKGYWTTVETERTASTSKEHDAEGKGCKP